MQKRKLTKLNISCDLRCLAKCEELFENFEAQYGIVKYDYGNRHNLHGKDITEHHKIPQACGGGNESSNLVYANRAQHDVVHEIYDIKGCREYFLRCSIGGQTSSAPAATAAAVPSVKTPEELAM